MKRCPQCNRLETDDALALCRADGTPLISDSGLVNADAGTVKLTSAPVSSEIETSVLPHRSTSPEREQDYLITSDAANEIRQRSSLV